MADLRMAVEDLLDAFEGDVPDKDCSCHISPPCGDCIEWDQQRKAIALAHKALAAERARLVPPAPTVAALAPPCARCSARTRLACAGPECPNRPPELPPIPVNQTDEE